MNRDLYSGLGLMTAAAGVGAGVSLIKGNPAGQGADLGLRLGTIGAALVAIFDEKRRNAAAITTAVGIAALFTEDVVRRA